MSAVGDDEVDYESDPEEAKRALAMRRREASDDEEEGGAGERDREGMRDSRDEIDSDEDESEGQGEAEEYYEDEGEEESEEYRELEEGGEEERERVGLGAEGGRDVEVAVKNEGSGSVPDLGEAEVGEEGKKENEPFAVPTAGAFYMHDDRFRNNSRGRNRRMLGGRKLWESQNESKWGHDKYEEITDQDLNSIETARNSRGRYRGRGKNRGGGRGNPRGDKSKVYDSYNQNQVPKITKGRGFRKYDTLKKNKNEAPQYRQRSSKSVENAPHAASGRASTASKHLESGPVSSTKQTFASSLNSASPPFYPSGSSNKETAWVQKKDVPAGNVNRNSRSADIDDKFSVSQANTTRGRNGIDSVGMNRLQINDSVSSKAPMFNSAHPRAQGRGVASSGQMAYQPVAAPHSQATRASTPSQYQTMQKNSIQSGRQSSSQSSVHQSRQFHAGGSQNASNLNNFEQGDSDSPSEASKYKSALVAKEKGGVQGGSSFMYGGSQVMAVSGNMSSGHGDQNFPAGPTFLPVMPFGGQHPGGMGVPAVGMAFPGYMAQPNGLGNSEMTWLPVLAGAAGALGSAYGSPYIAALENAYHSRPAAQQTSSSGASSKESNANKSNNEWKPSQTPEVAGDEVGLRQKNFRRYSEMNAGQ